MFHNVRIETVHLLLRNSTMEDLSGFHAILSQPKVTAFLPEEVMSLEGTRIVVVVDHANVASVRVIEKIGMIYDRRPQGLHDRHSAYEGHLYYVLEQGV